MTHFPVVVKIGKEVTRYSIPANSPGEALTIMCNKISVTAPIYEFDGNFEVIYTLNGCKRYALVFADNPRLALQKLKQKIGNEYHRILIHSITEINKHIGEENID